VIARLTAVLVGVLSIAAAPTAARTWHVEKDGSGDYTVIYEAVDAAAAGDTILIGPGRFEEYRLEPDYASETYCCVHVTTSDLTLIGSGAEATTIGLDYFDPHYEYYVIGISSLEVDVNIENLAVNGVFEGVHFEGSNLYVQHCDFVDCDGGVVTWSVSETTVNRCRFIGTVHNGLFGAHANGVSVSECEFTNVSRYAITGVGGVGWVVRDTQFHDGSGGIQFEQGATGIVERCCVRVAGGNPPAIGLLDGTCFVLHDNEFQGETWAAGFATGGTTVTARNNVFIGGTGTTIEINRTPMDFHQNDIINGGGLSVIAKWERGSLDVPYDLDLTGNYWGTDNPAQISEWIEDYGDHGPMELWWYVTVRYDPYASESTPVESHTWTEVKQMFRPSGR